MKAISFVASDSDNVLWDRLSTLFESASVLRISSAFLGAGDELISWIEKSRERRAEVVVRLEYPTNHASVASLLKHPRIAIRGADPAKMPFHEKLFLAISSTGEPLGAYIGSANWTQGGLRRNQEAGVWISEQAVLGDMARHFKARFNSALQISDAMLAELRADFLWQSSHGKRPRKDRGTLLSSWSELRGRERDGSFLIKQNGISSDPFVEGEDEFCEFIRNHSSQTLSKIPSTFEQGLGVIVSWIARRRDGAPDRLIYGRGRIAGFDRERWKLPDKYLAALGRRGINPDKIEHLRQWPEVLWLDPAEYINYPRSCDRFLWLSDYMDPSFQGGFRWILPDVWKACNQALNEHTDKFGVLPLDRQGIWWNQHVGITDSSDSLFMTKARIEEMNLTG